MDPASLAEDSLRSYLRKVRRGYLTDVSDLAEGGILPIGGRLDSLTTTPISLLPKHRALAATRARFSKPQAGRLVEARLTSCCQRSPVLNPPIMALGKVCYKPAFMWKGGGHNNGTCAKP